jgi:nucleotide-binding universal stress UspA family protein
MRVLLGIGGTEDSFHALDRTIDRSESAGDDLVIAILDDPNVETTPAEVFERVRSALAERDASADVRRVTGDPRSELVSLADGGDFDQLVLGGGTRSPMGKIRVGDIAEFVLLNATTTVKLVR